MIGGGRLSLAGATLLNGYLITAVTMCDVYRPTVTHVTPEVIPAALAIAEQGAAAGRDLIVALAAGCEATTRIGLGLDYPQFRKRGWHGPGVIGPFGAAAAAGRLLRFDADTMARAFGLAGSQAAGTFAAWGTPTVKFHQCRGALSGLMAALLAGENFQATREFLTAPDGGLYDTYTDGGRPEEVTRELGSRWELQQIGLRLWPCGSAIQGLITAIFDLVHEHGVGPAELRKLSVTLSSLAFRMHGNSRNYQGKFEAMISAHYAAAVILHDRELSLSQYERTRYEDPALRAFAASRIEVKQDDALSDLHVIVVAHMADGSSVRVECQNARGTPENPLSRGDIQAKFRTYASSRLPASAIDGVIDAVANLEDVNAVGDLMSLLRS